jgi:hypothetical protein
MTDRERRLATLHIGRSGRKEGHLITACDRAPASASAATRVHAWREGLLADVPPTVWLEDADTLEADRLFKVEPTGLAATMGP